MGELNVEMVAILDFISSFKSADMDELGFNFPYSDLKSILGSLVRLGLLHTLDGFSYAVRDCGYKSTTPAEVEPLPTDGLVKVLDKGFVKLVDHMGSDLRTVNSARISFGRSKEVLDDNDISLINYLAKHDHLSPFRSNQLVFHVKAPIFVLRQWMKHVVGSVFSEMSSRYVEFNGDFFIPDELRYQSKVNKQGSEGRLDSEAESACIESYLQACNQCVSTYHSMVNSGVCKEQARCVLPVSMYSEIYWTASLQAVAHFIHQRLDSHAQKEIRDYAQVIKDLTSSVFPHSLTALLDNNP